MISAFCFFKNEAEQLRRTVPSWVPFVDEIVLVDTGSTDDSVKVAQRAARESKRSRPVDITSARLDWRDDFADAANESAALCKHRWRMKLDADELLRGDPVSFREAVKSLERVSDGRGGFARQLLLALFEPTPEGGEKEVCYRARCFRWVDGWRYRYIIDEEPAPPAHQHQLVLPFVHRDIANVLHLRTSYRPESLARAVEFARRGLGASDLDQAAIAHYNHTIERAKMLGWKET